VKANWNYVSSIRAQARIANARQLSLAKRLHYLQLYLLSKIWYMAQTLLPHTKHVQQLTSVCTWYIWRGAPFRVPVTTLRRPKDQGGWAMKDIGGKCRTLLFSRIWTLSNKDGSLTAALMRHWNLNGSLPNPHFLTVSPPKSHISASITDMAYFAPPGASETIKQFKLRLYGVLRAMTATMEDAT
jgi:hypothetical protein